jgi:phage tail-like protein
MPGQGTHENRYLIEVDGVAAVAASEMTPPSKDHTPVELYVGNQPNPVLSRGNFKIGDFSFKHAHALNQAGADLFQWMDNYTDGIDLTKRTARLVVLDEDGATPVAEYELQECVPTSFKPETHSASGTNASMFSFTLRPTNMRNF